MQMIIWAISSMVILMLIIYFLPLGYTLKGKLLLVLISFILSLGGLGSVSIIPLWETALMLLALVFFAAYFINNRLGSVLFQESPVYEEQMDEEYETSKTYYEVENLKDGNLVMIENNSPLPDPVHLNLEKDTETELSPALVLSKIKDGNDNVHDSIDMDISFLLERDTEVDTITQMDDKNEENAYLSHIESLLELESKTVKLDSLEETLELSPILGAERLAAELEEDEQELSDESLFDFLLAKKEIAIDRAENLEVIKPKEKVSLQK
ncbi:hypothetical protein V7103_17045 [Neobacillus drentensis]|uniref:hypothetical protein n=1 Tax=Neobacillus drentensis TaxID=220684 RepID=UPI002FFDF486